MYAVIKTGGKQYRVQPGDVIVVEKLAGDAGSDVTLGEVLMLGGDKGVTLGAPLIDGASVAATLVETRKGEKIKIFKKIRRQGYRRTGGHRQMESVLRIVGIEGAGVSAKWDGETSLMTKAEMNLRARGLAPRVEDVEAKPVKAKKPAPRVVDVVDETEAAPAAEAPVAKTAKAKPAAKAEAAAPEAKAESAAKEAPAKKPAAKAKPAASDDA